MRLGVIPSSLASESSMRPTSTSSFLQKMELTLTSSIFIRKIKRWIINQTIVISLQFTYFSLATMSMEYVMLFGQRPNLFISDRISIAFSNWSPSPVKQVHFLLKILCHLISVTNPCLKIVPTWYPPHFLIWQLITLHMKLKNHS